MTPEKRLDLDEVLLKLDQKSRFARTVNIVLTLLSVVILALVLFWTYRAVNNLRETENQAKEINAQVTELRAEASKLAEQKESLEKQREGLQNSINEANKLLSVGNASNDKTVQQARTILAKAGAGAAQPPITKPTVTPTPTPTPSNSPSEVYVQISDESQRAAANRLILKLRDGKFNFPGIERVKVPIARTQIKYHHLEDRDKAKELADKLGKEGIQAAIVHTNMVNEKKGLLEIWFSRAVFASKTQN